MKVYLTREKDELVDLKTRTDFANRLNADLLVSVHLNSLNGVARGTETFYNASNSNGQRLATYLQNELLAEFKLVNRGVKTNNLHMTRESKMPAALTEAAFISNPTEAALIKQSDFDERHGKAIARGIKKYVEWAGLKNPVIVLDPGHGGTSTGAASNGIREKDRVLAACLIAKKELEGDPLTNAVDVFVKHGIINSPELWVQSAVPGKTVRGDFVAALILKTAEVLRRL